jgi:chemotaxis signal transduction protein
MHRSAAWRLYLDDQLSAAIGEREMIHLISAPQLWEVPGAPLHCQEVLLWQGEVLPAMDLAAWLGGQRARTKVRYAAVLAYQGAPGTSPRYGALLLSQLPVRVLVEDEQGCPLPPQAGWPRIALSCFSQEGQPVPILDLPTVFGEALLGT